MYVIHRFRENRQRFGIKPDHKIRYALREVTDDITIYMGSFKTRAQARNAWMSFEKSKRKS